MNKKFAILFLTATMLSTALVGCGGAKDASKAPTATPTATETATPVASTEAQATQAVVFEGKYVVNADYVKQNKANIILVDARGEDAAKKGTIEGAVATNWQSLATCADGKSGDAMWGVMLDPARLSERLSALGLDKEKEIVLFGEANGGWGDEGRILWELVAAGYDNVKMVDGGIKALQATGLQTAKGMATPTPVTVTVEALDATHNINTDELKKDYTKYKIVDVRADEEYNGKVLYGEAKGGHLPGAIHIKFTDLFNEDGMLKSNEEITKIFEDNGISKTDNVVMYCTAGIRSAYMQLIAEMCGFENVKNYDESYYRWCNVNEVE
ncbi:MAG: sulfurtransferase [Cellulosilyticaceae bacterium]